LRCAGLTRELKILIKVESLAIFLWILERKDAVIGGYGFLEEVDVIGLGHARSDDKVMLSNWKSPRSLPIVKVGHNRPDKHLQILPTSIKRRTRSIKEYVFLEAGEGIAPDLVILIKRQAQILGTPLCLQKWAVVRVIAVKFREVACRAILQ
jgi:hypothetical protein